MIDGSTPSREDWEALVADGQASYAKRYDHEPIVVDGITYRFGNLFRVAHKESVPQRAWVVENLRAAYRVLAEAGAGIIPEREAIAENGLYYGDSLLFYVRDGLDWGQDVRPAIQALARAEPDLFGEYTLMPQTARQLSQPEVAEAVAMAMLEVGLDQKIQDLAA